MNSTMYDCIQMENSAWARHIYQPKFDTRRLIHRSGNAATRIDIIKSAGFNARIQLDGLNMYKTDTYYKGKHIGTAFGVRKGFRNKCTFICEASNRLTKNECWLRQEVHATLEIVQTLMQRVALLGSYASSPRTCCVHLISNHINALRQLLSDFKGLPASCCSECVQCHGQSARCHLS